MAVNSTNTQQAGLLNDHRDAFLNTRRSSDPKVSMAMDLGLSSDKRVETRAYYTAAPHAQFRAYGDPVNEGQFDSVKWDTPNHIYDLRLSWSKYDREDDLTQSLTEQARTGGASLAGTPERALFDYINGTTLLMPSLQNASDGLAAYSATTRFETAGGNIEAGHSFASSSGVRIAIYAAHNRFRQFKARGEPLHPEPVLDSSMLVIYSSADNLTFAEAFNLPVVDNASGNAGISNILQAQLGGRIYTLWETSRLPAGTCVVFLSGAKKPFFMQTRTNMVESYGDDGNSDDARGTGREYVQWEQRQGFGAGVMFGTIKITG
ncbi:MAG: hypothetical protein DRH30_00885 [Deltaproteobacteria bacterium]|nr:MAG: hypothetical protein DRH30_00885 [Deltaproteobacteria bacterium]